MSMKNASLNLKPRSIGATILAIVIAIAAAWWKQQSSPPVPRPPVAASPDGRANSPAPRVADDALVAAVRDRRSYVVVESRDEVVKVLPDDNDGARHQKFLVRLAGGDTILIAHNLDLAQRVPIRERDAIEFKGEYIWNDRGGVMHWTHHDPARRHEAGWVRINGKTYD